MIWDQTIPKDVQILITHQPPGTFDGHSEPLQQHVEEVKPILHVFGHIHRVRKISIMLITQFYQ